MFAVFLKEIKGFLNSLIGYIAIVIFLILTGLFVWVFPETNVLDYGFADMYTFFSLTPYVYLFLIPAVTMRSFAEEKKSGTMELLLTRPLTDTSIILGKFFACWVLVLLALIPTLVYYYSLYDLGSPEGNIDSAGVAGSYLALLLLGGAFTSVGLCASSLTENQIVAFIGAVFLCFAMYQGLSELSKIDVWADFSYPLQLMSLSYHYESMSKGLIDSRNLIFFISVMVLMLWTTRLVLGRRKW